MNELGRDIVISLHSIIFFLSVVGNGLVILTLARHRRMRTVTNVFLLNLAISDLLVSVVCMPFTIIPVLMQNFIFGQEICIVVRYLQGATVAASAFTLVAISLERYFAICSPLQARKWQVLSHSYKVIALIWVAALGMNAPLAAFHVVQGLPNGVQQCFDVWPSELSKKAWYTFQLIAVDLVAPLLIMCVAYFMIATTLWNDFGSVAFEISEGTTVSRKESDSADSDKSDDADKLSSKQHLKKDSATTQIEQHSAALRSHACITNSQRSKKKVIKMLFVIVVEFFICWSPLYTVTIWYIIDLDGARETIAAPQVVLAALRLLAYTSSCCNPITYCFMSKKFRAAFLSVFRCRKTPTRFDRRFQSTQISYCENSKRL